MPSRKKPALLVIWNKDLTLSVYRAAGGARLIKLTIYPWHHVPGSKSWLEACAAFCEGWFGTSDRDQWHVSCKVA